MVLVQDLPGLPHVEAVLGLHAPGQAQNGVQPGAEHGGLGGGKALAGEAVQLLVQLLLHLVRGGEGVDPGGVLLHLGHGLLLLVHPQLHLYGAQLLPQDALPMVRGQASLGLPLDLLLHLQHGDFVGQQLIQQLQPPDGLRLLQKGLPVVRRKAQGLAQVVRDIAGAVPPGDAPQEVRVVLRQQLRQVGHQATGATDQGLPVPGGLLAPLLLLPPELRPVEGEALRHLAQLRPVQAADQHPHPAAGDAQELPHLRHGAHPEEVGFIRLLRLRLRLAEEEDPPVPLHGGVHRGDGEGALQVEIQHQLREHVQPPEGDHWQTLGFITHGFSLLWEEKYVHTGARKAGPV